jgi:large subunit ribosomal protein L5
MSLTKEEVLEEWKKTEMRKPMVKKLILHSCVGEAGAALQRVKQIIESIAEMESTETRAKRNIREFGLRKNQPIGIKVTIRDPKKIESLLPRLLVVKDNKIPRRSFDNEGNFAFGITEHINIPGTKYDPNLGVTGLDVQVRLERPGFRIKNRFRRSKKIPEKHRISQEEAIIYAETELDIKVDE